MRVEKILIQTLACQFSSTRMQLLFWFDQGMRVKKTLIQTLASQLLLSLDQSLLLTSTCWFCYYCNSVALLSYNSRTFHFSTLFTKYAIVIVDEFDVFVTKNWKIQCSIIGDKWVIAVRQWLLVEGLFIMPTVADLLARSMLRTMQSKCFSNLCRDGLIFSFASDKISNN